MELVATWIDCGLPKYRLAQALGVGRRTFDRYFFGRTRIPPVVMVALQFVKIQCGMPVRMTGKEWIEGRKSQEAPKK